MRTRVPLIGARAFVSPPPRHATNLKRFNVKEKSQ
jgi:hypothetical protein